MDERSHKPMIAHHGTIMYHLTLYCYGEACMPGYLKIDPTTPLPMFSCSNFYSSYDQLVGNTQCKYEVAHIYKLSVNIIFLDTIDVGVEVRKHSCAIAPFVARERR